MPNFAIYNNVKQPKKREFVKKRSAKNLDPVAFQNDLLQLILYKIINLDNYEDACKYTHKISLHILNKHYPVKILTKKEQELERKPWITRGILNSTRIKNKTFRQFKKSKTDEDYKKFKTYRDLINKLKRNK